MLVECGFVRAQASDGGEYTFTPSLARIATLGSPHEIVSLYAALHGPNAAREAAYVLACLCDQEDPSPLIGEYTLPPVVEFNPGAMPEAEQIIIARHLMQHGIVGKARPGKGGGQYSEAFHAAGYIAAARVHLGLSSADAEALSMTEFQQMLEMKYPDVDPATGKKKKVVPSREEYQKTRAANRERFNG